MEHFQQPFQCVATPAEFFQTTTEQQDKEKCADYIANFEGHPRHGFARPRQNVTVSRPMIGKSSIVGTNQIFLKSRVKARFNHLPTADQPDSCFVIMMAASMGANGANIPNRPTISGNSGSMAERKSMGTRVPMRL